jgi:hypothetical protein
MLELADKTPRPIATHVTRAGFKQMGQRAGADLPTLGPCQQPRGEAPSVEAKTRIIDQGRWYRFPTTSTFIDA